MRNHRGGLKPTAYADPPTAHVRALLESGWKQVDLSRASGISCRTISTVSNNRVKRVFATTANALLAIEPKGTNE
ncbi:helix-turn-helix transcriptional regulator [Dermabacter hominis]|uniref:helix-turn-helix transcriptional regulator n=1 Tax=Dermabacter hominis TaxID=36740 RepID=UPI0021A33E80|nr:helix-turn-helix transcriptional regulator [Dermabacter hominis]MCT2056919.1 helix-turn-helix transcriptional regulator [Dermabacter hominis]MCT2084394.1 helix-turn-helix transcriptional regulator [Dermabacter hominis]MCT2091775.1 helix-turn-helix transcriptional regulator [Dermabacter hominis]MCT2190818.1 helix-turn-helix transcriptional regulator [Dermabacter hominis]MCT2227971.1 helix-turn-helix transcriptional regulator [Dermabacter hominis]